MGVDSYVKVLYRAVERAEEQGLANILFVRAPIQFLYPLLQPASVQSVYVHYPDPHLRSRGQHKIINPTFLDAMHRALYPDGTLSLMTDHEGWFLEEVLPLVEGDPRWRKLHNERYLVGYEPGVKSRYQKMWERHDVPPLRLMLAKCQKEQGETDG